jgi:hypothetical protein
LRRVFFPRTFRRRNTALKKRSIAVVALLLASAVPSIGDDARWFAIGRTAYVRTVYDRFDGGGYCACPFNGRDVCRPSSACFKAGTSIFLRAIDPPVPGVKPGITSLPVDEGGDCYNGDGFNVEPYCEDLGTVLGPCAKTQEVQFGLTPSGAGTRTTILYRCVSTQAAQCIGITGHLTPSTRVEWLTDAFGHGGGAPTESAAWLRERVWEEGCL